MLFGGASKSETSLIFMKSICKMIVPRQELNIMLETSFFSIWSSLRASFLGRSGSEAGKGRIACNYISGIWISASKKWNADWRRGISNDVMSLAHVFRCLFTFTLVSASRWLAEIWRLSQWGARSSSFSQPSTRVPWRVCLQAASEANECLSEELTLKGQIPVCKFISIYLISIIWWLWKINL